MNIQSSIKLLLVSAAAVCCVLPAYADSVTLEATGNVASFQGGGWGGNPSSEIGQQVTVDFSYDPNSVTSGLYNELFISSTPITSAGTTSGVLGSGINLEPDGPGTGIIVDKFNLYTGEATSTAVTSAYAPSRGFTGDVFGLSFFSDGLSTTIDLVRNAFSNGSFDRPNSGSVSLSDVSVGVGVAVAPEIDPASALSALTMLAGSLAVIRGRKLGKLQAA